MKYKHQRLLGISVLHSSILSFVQSQVGLIYCPCWTIDYMECKLVYIGILASISCPHKKMQLQSREVNVVVSRGECAQLERPRGYRQKELQLPVFHKAEAC